MISFVHAADIHLDSPLRGLQQYPGAPVREIRGATRKALENLANLAIEESVSFVCISGDLYDGDWKDYNTALFLADVMRRLKEAGIPVFWVKGNHDAESRITRSLNMPENVRMLSARRPETVILKDLGVAIHGQGFAHSAIRDDLSKAFPEAVRGCFNIGMLHTSLTGRPGHENYAPCSVAGLASKQYDYWALGHVHQGEIVSKEPWIVFSGCIQGRNVREAGIKGCSLVKIDNGEVVSVEHRALDVFRWGICNVNVEGVEGPEKLVSMVAGNVQKEVNKNGGKPLAVRIVLVGACGAHDGLSRNQTRWVNEVREAVMDSSGGRAWVEKVALRTVPAIDLGMLSQRDDPIGDIVKHVNELCGDEEKLVQLAGELETLQDKLPRDLLDGPDAFDPGSPEVLRSLLERARDLLLARLLEEEQK